MKIRFAILILFIIYIVIGFFGYGNDNDIYLMMKTGQTYAAKHYYEYSRPPGYFLPEFIVSIASYYGSYFLANLISSLLSVSTLLLLSKILEKFSFKESDVIFIILFIGLNPYYVIASSSAMDYIYSLFFAMVGIFCLSREKIILAGLFCGFAVGSRLSNGGLILIVYLYYFIKNYKKNVFLKLFISGIVLLVTTALLYFPSYKYSNNSFSFLTYWVGKWTFFEVLSRFIYKNIFLIGILPLAVIAILFLKNKKSGITFNLEVIAIFALVIFYEMLFFKIPLEISYLLPVLLVFPIIVLIFFNLNSFQKKLILSSVIIYSFVLNIDFLEKIYRTNNIYEGGVVGGKIGVFFRKGVVIDDIMKREASESYWFKEYGLEIYDK